MRRRVQRDDARGGLARAREVRQPHRLVGRERLWAGRQRHSLHTIYCLAREAGCCASRTRAIALDGAACRPQALTASFVADPAAQRGALAKSSAPSERSRPASREAASPRASERSLMRAVDIIRAKRDGEALSREAHRRVRRRRDRRLLGRLPGLGAAHGHRPARHDRRGDGLADRRDGAIRPPRRSLVASRHQGRQAQHRRRRRQGLDRARAARRRRAASSCRRCPAAASATPAARSTSSRRFPASASRCRSTSSWRRSRDVGCCLISQTKDIAPADKTLYALRDVTATIESIPLISASVMSKKIAEGSNALVLDVKCGSGAFMKTIDDARALARSLVAIGTANGVRTEAFITGDGHAARLRRGQCARDRRVHRRPPGPRARAISRRVVVRLAARMVQLGGRAASDEDARARGAEALASGAALAKFAAMIARQGGDARIVDDPGRLPRAGASRTSWRAACRGS